MIRKIKGFIRYYLNDDKTSIGKFIEYFIISLNIITVIVFIIESYYYNVNPSLFWKIEIVTVSIFIIEYILRLWTAENKFKHMLHIYSLIDLIAILPTLVTFIDMRFVRILRVFRIFRFMRYIKSNSFLSKDVRLHQVRIVRIIFIITTIIFVFSSFIYEVEKNTNPLINNLGDAVYFSIVTLTTVGYGDITPITNIGKEVTVLMILISIALIPWQLALLVREIIFSISRKRFIICDKCGLRQHDVDATHCKHCGSIIYQEADSV